MTTQPLVLLLVLCLSSQLQKSASAVELREAQRDGQACDYDVYVQGKLWLTCSAPYFHLSEKYFSTSDSSLKKINSSEHGGQDKLGLWTSVETLYLAGTTHVITTVKTYPVLGAVVYEQYFPEGATGTDVGNPNRVVSAFPSYVVGGQQVELGYLSYGGMMVGETTMWMDRWTDKTINIRDGVPGGPLVLFDKTGSTLIISPFNEFMAASSYHEGFVGGTNSWGIMGRVTEIPSGYRQQTVVFHGENGINRAFEDWGTLLRKWYNTERLVKDDLVVNYLGYWTDNGSYYYYNTEKGQDYESTLVDVVKYAQSQGIPYRYLQYDSWWYYEGILKGVTRWEGKPTVFPSGMVSVFNKTKLPVIAHNRWWSSLTPYSKKHGGKFDFVVEVYKSIPTTQAFWDWLLSRSKEWGLITYEQDWMNVQFLGMNSLQHNISLGRDWLMAMGKAAEAQGLTIQYCMSNPRHALQSLELPAVTQARVSDDYHPSTGQWKIGISSIFAHALRLSPYKDTFWSTQNQPGNPLGDDVQELYSELMAVVSVLSTGPVGPGDGIGKTNVSMLLRCCNKDGLILKPSKPATAIDAQIYQAAFNDGAGPNGEVWTTFSDISGHYFGTVLAAQVIDEYSLTPSEAGFSQKGKVVVYRDDPYSVTPGVTFSDDNPLVLSSCTRKAFCFYHTSPVFIVRGKEVVLYGEISKFVPISPKRVTSMSVSDSDVTLMIQGVPDETVDVWVGISGAVDVIKCTITSSRRVKISVMNMHCTQVDD